jgi:ketosteroid isomerase-like protein
MEEGKSMSSAEIDHDKRRQAVRALYDKVLVDFSKGEALNLFAPEFVLDNPLPTALPFGGLYQGVEGVARYMRETSATLDLLDFHVGDIFVDGDHCFVKGRERCRFRASGGIYEMEWVHAVLFDARGRYLRLREYNDTAAMLIACTGQ